MPYCRKHTGGERPPSCMSHIFSSGMFCPVCKINVIYISELTLVNADRGTGWLRSPYRRARRERNWCLSVRELGAAPRRQSRRSAASVASGSSAWCDARASPHACSSASGQCVFKAPRFWCFIASEQIELTLTILRFVSQEQLCVRFIPEQRWDRFLRPHTWWKTLCHTLFWHFSVFGL